MTPNPITDIQPSADETSFLRFIASSARPLKRDPDMTAMSALDTLHRVYRKYQKYWFGVIWIVCMDGYADITPNTPIEEAIRRIEAHKGAAGIVGMALIARTFTFLKKPLRKGKEAQKRLEESGNAAADRFLKLMEPIAAEAKFLREQMENPKKHS